jgi:hypothetical protein
MGLVNGAAHQSLKTEVAQLERLKVLLEKQGLEE